MIDDIKQDLFINQNQLKTITQAPEHLRLMQDINLKFIASFFSHLCQRVKY